MALAGFKIGEPLDAFDILQEATRVLQQARITFSKEWQLARAKVNSDYHATQIAIENTNDALTHAQSSHRAAEITFQRAVEVGEFDGPKEREDA